MSGHRRNTEPMLASRRCGARTRSGGPCQAPAVAGKARCRMHGGAPRTGAPKGNRNALKDGLHTATARRQRQRLTTLVGDMERTLAGIIAEETPANDK
jgi:hypothetical protein